MADRGQKSIPSLPTSTQRGDNNGGRQRQDTRLDRPSNVSNGQTNGTSSGSHRDARSITQVNVRPQTSSQNSHGSIMTQRSNHASLPNPLGQAYNPAAAVLPLRGAANSQPVVAPHSGTRSSRDERTTTHGRDAHGHGGGASQAYTLSSTGKPSGPGTGNRTSRRSAHEARRHDYEPDHMTTAHTSRDEGTVFYVYS